MYVFIGKNFRHLACEEDRLEEAKLLIIHGGRLNIQNKAKQTPLDLAPEGTAKILKKIAESDDDQR